MSELTKRLTQLAEVLEAKGLEAAAKAEVHRRQNEPDDAAKEDKRAVGGKMYAKACRDIVSENEELGKKLATKEKRGAFIPPSLVEVVAEMKRWGLPYREAAKFIAHYSSNGWKVGSNGMRDWKQAIVTWRERYFETHASERPQSVAAAGVRKILSAGDEPGWKDFLKSQRMAYQPQGYAPKFLKDQFAESPK